MHIKNIFGKRYVPAHRRPTSGHKKLQMLLGAFLAVLLSVTSGVTLAYVFTGTSPVKNTFDNSFVACEVKETFDGVKKSNVRIKNVGEVQSYIRAAVVVTWMSADGKSVTAAKPVEGTDFEIRYTGDTNWQKAADGYWYYKIPVNVGAETPMLIEECALVSGVTPPEGFYLSVEIVASSLQSTPSDVVTDNWKNGVSGVDGTTLEIIS